MADLNFKRVPIEGKSTATKAINIARKDGGKMKPEDIVTVYEEMVRKLTAKGRDFKIAITGMTDKWRTIKEINKDLDFDVLYDYWENEVKNYDKFKEFSQVSFYIWEK